MMSEEKRFDIVGKEFVGYTEGYAYIIRDNSIVCELHRWRQWSVWEDKEDVEELCDLLNEQDEKIKVLQNSWEIMNERLSEKSKCDYKKAIIEFCKFMHINNPLVEVMVDEFLQEVF